MPNYTVFAQNPITPAPGVIIITPYFEENQTKAGPGKISVADDMARKELGGVVLAVGAEGVNVFGVKQTTTAQVGDVVFHKTVGVDIYNHHGLDLRFVEFSDIRGIIHNG